MRRFCLFCHQPLENVISWQSFLFLQPKNQQICSECEEKLQRITGEICKVCGRPLANLPPDFYTDHLCYDCKYWEEHFELKDVLQQNRSIYVYNEFLKEILARFKFRGDHELIFAFESAFQTAFKQYYASKKYVIVPIPLSNERLYERGFNQANSLALLLHQQVFPLLERIHLEKQSKKSRKERLHSKNIFSLKQDTSVVGCDILLIDDIYTTGTTLRHAAKILHEAKAKSVSALTLIRS